MSTIVILGIAYLVGFTLTMVVLYAAFPDSELVEVVLYSLIWPVVLPIVVIGLSG